MKYNHIYFNGLPIDFIVCFGEMVKESIHSTELN